MIFYENYVSGIKNSEVISMIESGHRLELPAKMPGPLYQLVYKCWSYEPSDRPTFKNMTTSIRQLMESYSEVGLVQVTRSYRQLNHHDPLISPPAHPETASDRQEPQRSALSVTT